VAGAATVNDMDLTDKVAVITGGASGIGLGLAKRFLAEGARHVVVADRDADGVERASDDVRSTGVVLDVTDEQAIVAMVNDVESNHGPIDLFVSNAGYVTIGGLEIPDEEMTTMFDVHVMSHIYAARAVLPSMIARGEGYLLNTASAAGLLSQIGSVAYSVTKHAAVALAEWISITHGDQGIRVSVLCPQAVATNIGANSPSRDRLAGTAAEVAGGDGVLTTEQLSDAVIDALGVERFWVLPHPEVEMYAKRKSDDIDRWLTGMRRFQRRLYPDVPNPGEWLVAKGLSG